MLWLGGIGVVARVCFLKERRLRIGTAELGLKTGFELSELCTECFRLFAFIGGHSCELFFRVFSGSDKESGESARFAKRGDIEEFLAFWRVLAVVARVTDFEVLGLGCVNDFSAFRAVLFLTVDRSVVWHDFCSIYFSFSDVCHSGRGKDFSNKKRV